MKIETSRIRAGLLAISLLSMLWGYRLMLLDHAPTVFAGEMEDMSYGWYVPLFSVYVLWRERGELLRSLGAPSGWGFLLLAPAALAGFLGIRGHQLRLEIVGFAATLVAVAWIHYGGRTARRVLFPAAFLLFCMPLATFLDVVTVHLRLLAVAVASSVLSGLGVDVVRCGTMLASASGAFSIDVAEPCSGLRSLFAMMALTAGYAYFNQPTWPRRALLFALSIPIAILGNVARILSIALVGSLCSPTFATGFYHDYSGYVIFLFAIALMLLTNGLITWGAERCARR